MPQTPTKYGDFLPSQLSKLPVAAQVLGVGGPTSYSAAIPGLGETPDLWENMGAMDRASYLSNPKLADLNYYGSSPHQAPLQKFIDTLDTSYSGGSYKARDRMAEALPEFDAMRRRMDTKYNREHMTAQDALDRQFAALGGGPSGAQMKQTTKLAGKFAEQKSQDALALEAEEAKARRGLQESEYAKEFQSGEAARGYGFQGKLAGVNAKMQGLTGLANLDIQWKTQQKEAMNDLFDKMMAQYQARHSGGLLGGGGILGTGIGA